METLYNQATLKHELGGLDVLYASQELLERAPQSSAGHQAIGNVMWQEDPVWRVAARGCAPFEDQVMLSRGMIVPHLAAGLPCDMYLLVRKLGSGQVGCGRLAMCLEWFVSGATTELNALSGRNRPLDTAWASADMSLSDFHRGAVGPGLVWESGNGLCNPLSALAPPPRVTQGTPNFFANLHDASIQLPYTEVQSAVTVGAAAMDGGVAEGVAAGAGGGAGGGAAAAPLPRHLDPYAAAMPGMVSGLQSHTRAPATGGFLAGLWGGLKKLVGGGDNSTEPAAAPEATPTQEHFAYSVGDIIGMQWDGAGTVHLVRNGAVVGSARVWPEGQDQAATPAQVQAAVAAGGTEPLHWPEHLAFVVLSTAGCEFEIVHHREHVDRMRRSGDGTFAEAYYAEYGPMPPHEGDLYPCAAVRTICQ